jgi:hypothetical protein
MKNSDFNKIDCKIKRLVDIYSSPFSSNKNHKKQMSPSGAGFHMVFTPPRWGHGYKKLLREIPAPIQMGAETLMKLFPAIPPPL